MIQKVIFILSCFILANSCEERTKQKINEPFQTKDSNFIYQRNKIISDSLFEEKIYDTLFKLPEVQTMQHQIDSISNHKHGVAFMLDTISNHQFIIKTGYNSEVSFVNQLTFYVDSTTLEIKVYDYKSDGVISLNDFRKNEK